jgi:hypothetical protein
MARRGGLRFRKGQASTADRDQPPRPVAFRLPGEHFWQRTLGRGKSLSQYGDRHQILLMLCGVLRFGEW